MIRTCDENDVRATVFDLPTCGETYDDLDHSTVCPHEPIPSRLDRLTQVRTVLAEAKASPCSCGTCPTTEVLAAQIAQIDEEIAAEPT